jgi:putative sterol carrier protein
LIMADTIERFFQELEEKGHQPLLGKVRGTVRFDLADGDGEVDHWLMTVDHGDFTITHGEGEADCTMRTDRTLFEKLITGEENALAATLRGALVCAGNVELLFAIQRIFPGPPRARQMVGEEMAST